MAKNSIIFLIQCPDQKGLISEISNFFYARSLNIIHCQQYVDKLAGIFFMRMELELESLQISRREMEENFADFAKERNLTWSVHYTDRKQRVALLVTKTSHCLYDLLVRQQEGEIDCEIPFIISNRPVLESVADKFEIPFYCFPITKETKPQQEQQIREMLEKHHIDLVVMARYMQILSEDFTRDYAGKVINIHHAFLPSFQGANPYRQAYERGVKMIGATAHYATADLDEGPIITQEVESVNHKDTPEDLTRIGRDVERVVLAKAVKAHLEHRIIIEGNKTVVFSAGGES